MKPENPGTGGRESQEECESCICPLANVKISGHSIRRFDRFGRRTSQRGPDICFLALVGPRVGVRTHRNPMATIALARVAIEVMPVNRRHPPPAGAYRGHHSGTRYRVSVHLGHGEAGHFIHAMRGEVPVSSNLTRLRRALLLNGVVPHGNKNHPPASDDRASCKVLRPSLPFNPNPHPAPRPRMAC